MSKNCSSLHLGSGGGAVLSQRGSEDPERLPLGAVFHVSGRQTLCLCLSRLSCRDSGVRGDISGPEAEAGLKGSVGQ